ncbi:serine/threonine-protein phosphatase [Candidatus Gracilibacteria bacterium]|nr:serine/threonine-protein phosphatase [Candidatus Gracilibacteria bacterium]
MGGHAAGEVASRIGVEAVLEHFGGSSADGEAALRNAFAAANTRIYTEGSGTMGTTAVAAVLQYNLLSVANVGDSRAYLIREGRPRQISRDHSLVSDQVAAGLMTPEQARNSMVRNIITRALGHQATVEVDIFHVGLRAGDTVLLSSDGMHGLIEDAEIAEIAGMLTPDETAERLVALANERGGIDNITVVVAQVDELDPHSPQLANDEAPGEEHVAEHERITEPLERPLTRTGLLLSLVTLSILLAIGGWSLYMP